MSLESPSPEEFEKINKYEAEIERVQRTLENFLGKENSRKVAAKIYDMALDIDASLESLLNDPRAASKYNYDGEFFETKSGHGFFKVLNGLGFLKKAASDSNIEIFFKHYKSSARAFGHMLWWLRDNYVWLAKARLLNWQERGDIGLVSKEVLEEILENQKINEIRDEGGVLPLSPGEQEFFKLYEEEANLPEGEFEEWLKKKREEQK